MNSVEQHFDVLAAMQDHKDVLHAFQGLPRDIKKYILTFYKTERRITFCPICGSGMYESAYYLPPFCHFKCVHNYELICRYNLERG